MGVQDSRGLLLVDGSLYGRAGRKADCGRGVKLGRPGSRAVYQYQLGGKVRSAGRLQSQFLGEGVGHLG